MNKNISIDIIGAGIGGLTTAIALKEKGFAVNIYEQAKMIKEVGAGIILANNAMQVYEKLDLKEELENSGNYISSVQITKSDLSLISNMDLRYFEEIHQVKNIAIHRGKLQQILVDQLDENSIHLDHQLKYISEDNLNYQLVFNDNQVVKSSLVLAADGLNSTVRQCLFAENQIRNAHQICWRGVTKFQLPKEYRHDLKEAWGNADRFGFVQIDAEKVYWYALKSFKNDPSEYVGDELAHYFADYHPLVKDIINATPTTSIHTAEMTDLKPINKWHKGNVCLIGDAAHATTPNMGQGACQAIEDAFVLAECMDKFELTEAFAKFQKIRMPKAHQVVNMSWTLGKLAHWSNPLSIAIRNQIMKWTPQSINRKQSEKLFQLASIPS